MAAKQTQHPTTGQNLLSTDVHRRGEELDISQVMSFVKKLQADPSTVEKEIARIDAEIQSLQATRSVLSKLIPTPPRTPVTAHVTVGGTPVNANAAPRTRAPREGAADDEARVVQVGRELNAAGTNANASTVAAKSGLAKPLVTKIIAALVTSGAAVMTTAPENKVSRNYKF